MCCWGSLLPRIKISDLYLFPFRMISDTRIECRHADSQWRTSPCAPAGAHGERAESGGPGPLAVDGFETGPDPTLRKRWLTVPRFEHRRFIGEFNDRRRKVDIEIFPGSFPCQRREDRLIPQTIMSPSFPRTVHFLNFGKL